MTDKMREDFEAWYFNEFDDKPDDFKTFKDGDYLDPSLDYDWHTWQAATLKANQWTPIADAPKGRKLLLGYHNKLGKWRTITGRYYLPQTLLMADDNDSLDDDGYAPEGWYEESETHDNILPTDEAPTHFMPLPMPPTGTGGNHD